MTVIRVSWEGANVELQMVNGFLIVFGCLFFSLAGLHSDLFLGSGDQSNQYDSNEELHQGMLSALTDDIINLIMSMDAVHFKTMLDKSRATSHDQEEELRRRQATIAELECKVKFRRWHKIESGFFIIFCFVSFAGVSDGC